MPPRKRKSPETDKTIVLSTSLPSSTKRTRATANTISSEPTSQSKHSNPGSSPSYTAKPSSPEYTYERQQFTCQGYKGLPDAFEKCVSCIVKKSILGGCRFQGIRAFKVLKDQQEVEEEDESQVNPDGAINGEVGMERTASKKRTRKSNGKKVVPPPQSKKELDYVSDWTFLGNQPDDYIPFSVFDVDPPSDSPAQSRETATALQREPQTKSLTTRSKRTTRGAAETSLSNTLISSTTGPPKVPNRVTHDTSPPTLLSQAKRTLTLIAPVFKDQLSREKTHEDINLNLYKPGASGNSLAPWRLHPRPLIRIQLSSQTRSLCDLCATTIFLGSYLCGCCGREYCLGCWEEWDTHPAPPKVPNRGVSYFVSCSWRRYHSRDTMVFTTRAAPGEINTLLFRVDAYTNPETISANLLPPQTPIPSEPAPAVASTLSFLPVPKIHHANLTPQLFSSHWYHSRGVPLVVTGLLDRFTLPWSPSYFLTHYGNESCLLNNCGSPTPEAATFEGHVRDFFSHFDHSQLLVKSRKIVPGSWKLKDWPPSDDFATVFPGLFQDFENALPQACWAYSTREGDLNLASKFPRGWNRPDLGPKMYNAYPAIDFLPHAFVDGDEDGDEDEDGEKELDVKGTTNLHLDITDAVNILVYASSFPTTLTSTNSNLTWTIPHESAAIWDIFPPSSASMLRAYLKSKSLKINIDEPIIDDPIHRQLFYLSEKDLAILKQKPYEVSAYRIYQRPGDAVFVPAGCPHQVRNVRGAVKVAVDFLSGEAVQVCRELVEEGRALAGLGGGAAAPGVGVVEGGAEEVEVEEGSGEKEKEKGGGKEKGENKKAVKKLGKREDVLQLWNCLYFAWGQGEGVIKRLEGQVGTARVGGGEEKVADEVK